MASAIKSDLMVLPYGMLLTHLYRCVLSTQPIAITDIHYLVDHVMVPLIEGRAHRFMVDGKRPHPQSSSGSSSFPSQTPTQQEVDSVDNFTLDPILALSRKVSVPSAAKDDSIVQMVPSLSVLQKAFFPFEVLPTMYAFDETFLMKIFSLWNIVEKEMDDEPLMSIPILKDQG
ncbi:hypothetical protein Tco_0300159 [Tanacetum coccineum]